MSAIARLLEAAPRYAKLLSSQYWPQERLASYREQHLEQTLSAARRIPFYAERLGGNARPADLARLPILRRADVEALNQSVRSLCPAGTRFIHSWSSATGGSAVNFTFDRSHQKGR